MSNNRNKDIHKFACFFKALSNPHRLKIYARLASCCRTDKLCLTKKEACACVGELGKDLGISASTVSHHLKELNQAGLLKMERHGQTIQCGIDPKSYKSLKNFFK